MAALVFVFIVWCCPLVQLQLTSPEGEGCTIELQCAECVPEHMPTVTSLGGSGGGRGGADAAGAVRLAPGDEVRLACGAGRFLAYPLHAALSARCHRGLYRLAHDNSTRPLLDLGCQESVFEDVLHQVERCAPPLEGRAYQMRESRSRTLHLATLCFDGDRGVAAFVRATGGALELGAHEHGAAPLSLLGNFNRMFDASTRRVAERLYSDDASVARRVRERFKHERFAFAGQSPTSARLLSGLYFAAEHRPVTEFASNKVAAWRSVAHGNLRLLQADVAALLRRGRGLQVYAGTHGVWAAAGRELFLREGRRFPVPRYIWTAVVTRDGSRGVALVVLNDPFVAVSEIRAAVFCESSCGEISWLEELTRHRHYERPIEGLVFCCDLMQFAAHVPEMPNVFNSSVARLVDII